MRDFFVAAILSLSASTLSAVETDGSLAFLEEMKLEEIDASVERIRILKAKVDSEVVIQAEIVQNLENIFERTRHGQAELDRALVKLMMLQNSQRSIPYELRANELRIEVIRTFQKLRGGEPVETGRIEALRAEEARMNCETLRLDADSARLDLELQKRLQVIYDELANVKRAVARSEWLMFTPLIAEIEARLESLRMRAAAKCQG